MHDGRGRLLHRASAKAPGGSGTGIQKYNEPQRKAKKYYDARHHVDDHFCVGDRILVYMAAEAAKTSYPKGRKERRQPDIFRRAKQFWKDERKRSIDAARSPKIHEGPKILLPNANRTQC